MGGRSNEWDDYNLLYQSEGNFQRIHWTKSWFL